MPSNALPRGYRLDEYVVESVLGTGGFGITYKAQDRKLGTWVAIKEYFPQDFAGRNEAMAIVPLPGQPGEHYEWGRQQFLKEVRALARFRHHNIVRVLRFLELNGTAYMIMDYESGQGLHDYIEKHGQPDERMLMQVFVPMLNGLQAVHQAGLLHLDIKPANIFLRTDRSPMLIDFGSVKNMARPSDGEGQVVLTPAYAAIEQYPGHGKQGPWTDIYSIGASLYRCVSGGDPVDAYIRAQMLRDGLPDPLTPAAQLERSGYSVYLRECIDWAMQIDAMKRPKDAAAFQEALMGKGIAGRKPASAKRPPEPRAPVQSTPKANDTATSNKQPPSGNWTVVDGVTDLAPPTSPPDAPDIVGISRSFSLRRTIQVGVVLAVIAGAAVVFSNYPGSVKQINAAISSMSSLFDRTRELATGEKAPNEVRYVGGVDPVPEEQGKKGAE